MGEHEEYYECPLCLAIDRNGLVTQVEKLEEENERLRKRVEELEDQLRWRKWPDEVPEASGRYLVGTDGSSDIGEHVSYYSLSAGWATKDAGIAWWRPIGPMPGGE